MSLARYGWSSFFQRQLPGPSGSVPGRVRLATARRAQVYAADRVVNVSVPRNVGPAAVGDWLLYNPRRRTAVRVLQARNVLARSRPGNAARRQVLASNVDTALVVAALDREFNARQIERYLVCVAESGAKAVIVLNKADLCESLVETTALCAQANPGYPVVATSALTGDGLSELEGQLSDQDTVALAGPSGAGKSSLVNALLETDHLRVGAVRSRDRRGKHTTTRRELVAHPRGWLLMDLPGIRELFPWSRPETVDAVFTEISGLGESCYYRDCRHGNEPGCAVLEALDEGRVGAARLDSYRELRQEQETLARMIEESRR